MHPTTPVAPTPQSPRARAHTSANAPLHVRNHMLNGLTHLPPHTHMRAAGCRSTDAARQCTPAMCGRSQCGQVAWVWCAVTDIDSLIPTYGDKSIIWIKCARTNDRPNRRSRVCSQGVHLHCRLRSSCTLHFVRFTLARPCTLWLLSTVDAHACGCAQARISHD